MIELYELPDEEVRQRIAEESLEKAMRLLDSIIKSMYQTEKSFEVSAEDLLPQWKVALVHVRGRLIEHKEYLKKEEQDYAGK